MESVSSSMHFYDLQKLITLDNLILGLEVSEDNFMFEEH
jgi:hypothetical protein